MGGETAWRAALDNPGVASILKVLLSTVHNLFSPKGLAALASYALLNLFFSFRFYRRSKELLRRQTERIMVSLRAELSRAWEESLDFILADLNRFREDIREQTASIAALKKESNSDGGVT